MLRLLRLACAARKSPPPASIVENSASSLQICTVSNSSVASSCARMWPCVPCAGSALDFASALRYQMSSGRSVMCPTASPDGQCYRWPDISSQWRGLSRRAAGSYGTCLPRKKIRVIMKKKKRVKMNKRQGYKMGSCRCTCCC